MTRKHITVLIIIAVALGVVVCIKNSHKRKDLYDKEYTSIGRTLKSDRVDLIVDYINSVLIGTGILFVGYTTRVNIVPEIQHCGRNL